MAIFGKDRAQPGTGNGSTIIAAGTQFVGNLTLSDTLHVDGRIDGDVQSESNVVIGSEGYLKGQVKAGTVVVSGRVDGSISADRLEIIAGGRVEGDVHIVDLVIEPGGRFNGSSEILAAETPQAHKTNSGNGLKPSSITPKKAAASEQPDTGDKERSASTA